jgi:hypothetical protein
MPTPEREREVDDAFKSLQALSESVISFFRKR